LAFDTKKAIEKGVQALGTTGPAAAVGAVIGYGLPGSVRELQGQEQVRASDRRRLDHADFHSLQYHPQLVEAPPRVGRSPVTRHEPRQRSWDARRRSGDRMIVPVRQPAAPPRPPLRPGPFVRHSRALCFTGWT